MLFVEHVFLHGFQEFRFSIAHAQAVQRAQKERIFGLGHAERAFAQELKPEVFMAVHALVEFRKLDKIYYNIFIFREQRKGFNRFFVTMVHVVLAVIHPRILVGLPRIENRKAAEPNGYCFRDFVVMDLLFVFRKIGKFFRIVVFVLAAKRLVRVVKLHAVAKEGVLAVLQFDVHKAVVLRLNPHIEFHRFVAGHEHVDVLFEFVSEIDDFVVAVEFEQAIEQVADGVLVVHQCTECRRISRNQIFHAICVLDNVGFCSFGFLFVSRHSFFLFFEVFLLSLTRF